MVDDSSAGARQERGIRVLSYPGEFVPGMNPFFAMLFGGYAADVRVQPFSWARAVVGEWDVLHLHFPEHLLHNKRAWLDPVRWVLFALTLLRLRATGRGSLATVHNDRPHEALPLPARLLFAWWFRVCDHRVYLSGTAMEMAGNPRRASVVPHGTYHEILQQAPDLRALPAVGARVLTFGFLRPYKGLEALVAAAAELAGTGEDLRFRIAGAAEDPQYAAELQRLAAGSRSVEVAVQRMSDEELEDEIRAADVVVLPYKRVYNSGALLLALTLARPVVVTESETTRELQREVGPQWVQLVPHPLTGTALQEALAQLRAQPRQAPPVFRGRDWADIGEAYSQLFRRLAGRPAGEELSPAAHGS